MEKTAVVTASTMFVQAEAHTFRELVQKLTGATDDSCVDKLPVSTMPARTGAREVGGPRRQGFKLQERRQNMRKLEIKLGLSSLRNAGFSSSTTAVPPPRSRSLDNKKQSCAYHHSTGGSSSPAMSPVTPLTSDTCFAFLARSRSETPSPEEAERVIISETGFYLSPLSTPRAADPPPLLPLFPLTSPKLSP